MNMVCSFLDLCSGSDCSGRYQASVFVEVSNTGYRGRIHAAVMVRVHHGLDTLLDQER